MEQVLQLNKERFDHGLAVIYVSHYTAYHLQPASTSYHLVLTYCFFVQASLELGVSSHYVGVWRSIFGEDISEGHVGLMGVSASLILIYDVYRNL